MRGHGHDEQAIEGEPAILAARALEDLRGPLQPLARLAVATLGEIHRAAQAQQRPGLRVLAAIAGLHPREAVILRAYARWLLQCRAQFSQSYMLDTLRRYPKIVRAFVSLFAACFDPEIPINVVELGLVYDVHLDEHSNAVLDMTLTSAACPLTDVITDQTESALEGLVGDVAINWVWMPPWGPDKITEDGREQLRALGFNV